MSTFEKSLRQQFDFWEAVKNVENVDQWNEAIGRHFAKVKNIVQVGSEALSWFVEINWTGVEEPRDLEQLCPFFSKAKEIEEILVFDGDSMVPVIKSLPLFFVARSLLFNETTITSACGDIFGTKMEQFRMLWVHQQLLSEKSEKIYKTAKNLN